MKPSSIAKTITTCYKAKQPLMIWGPPGVGKSQTVAQVAKDLGCDFIDLRIPLLDAVDLRGIPVTTSGTTKWMPPEFLPRKGKGFLFLDEIVQGQQIVQSAASQLILDRRVGEYTLPPEWYVLAAGNRDTDRAATNKMPSHIANRFVHANFEIDLEDWLVWAYNNQMDGSVVGFLQMRPELLHQFDPKTLSTEKAYPTPRSWEFVSKVVKDADVDEECFREIIEGTVGKAAASEYVGFFRVYRDLPEFEEIIKNPAKAKVPNQTGNSASLYAIATMIAYRGEGKYAKPLFDYIRRLPKEFQIITTRNIGKRNLDMTETRSYIQWQMENREVVLNK